MRKSYHVCVSSPDEVLFRSRNDYVRVLNCLALSLCKMETRLLADSFMTNHYHLAVMSDDVGRFVKSFRESYGKYFNLTYGRKGILGERHYYSIELEGLYHSMTAIDYILKNPVHHGVCVTPFEYEYNTSKCYFRKELGFFKKESYLNDNECINKYLPVNRSLPAGYKMNDSGIIVQEQYIESALVEKMYSSSRSYLYHMNRRTSEEWIAEQEKDENEKEFVTLETIEEGTRSSMHDMLSNEKRVGTRNRITDLEICELIDQKYVRRFRRQSYAHLTDSERNSIANELFNKYMAGKNQIIRCLGMKGA